MSRTGLVAVTGEQWTECIRQAKLLNDLAITCRVKPFAAAMAGAGFIRAVNLSPAQCQWWVELITMSPVAFFQKYGVHVDAVFAVISTIGSA